jgi:hypothetical protein
MFAPPICRRRWRNNAFSVLADPTKKAAIQRTSQRAKRAIKHSAMREQCNNLNVEDAVVAILQCALDAAALDVTELVG